MAHMNKWLSVAAGSSLAGAALGQPFVLEDFDPSPLSGTFLAAGTSMGFGDPQVAATVAAQGNPGNAAQLHADLTMGQSFALLDITMGGQSAWDTAVLGPILDVGFSVDVSGLPVSGATFASTVAYAFRVHDVDSPGTFYTTSTLVTPVGSWWTALTRAELTSDDFTPVLGGSDHPDLSTGRWGFNIAISAQRPSGAARWGGQYLVDNIEVDVTAPPPPAGPRVLLHAPTRDPDDVFYSRDPISRIKIAFDQPVEFTAADVALTSAASGPITGAIVTGDGTSLMQIDLAAGVANDAVTITIGPGVTSALSGLPLDGNGDGINGDPHTFTLRHLCLADVDDSSATDVFDLLAYLDAWFAGCP